MIENLECEEWCDIEGYEGLYQVSNKGRVKSLWYCKERILRPLTRNKYGYKYVELWKNKKMQKMMVHRLVAQSFIPNPENKSEIDHLDTNTSNNCVDNLSWVNHHENHQNKLTIEHHNQKPIYCYETDTTYYSANEAARQLNVHPAGVSKCCKGKISHTGNYHFCYANEIKKEE